MRSAPEKASLFTRVLSVFKGLQQSFGKNRNCRRLSCPQTQASMAASVAIGDRARGLAPGRWIPAFAGMTGAARLFALGKRRAKCGWRWPRPSPLAVRRFAASSRDDTRISDFSQSNAHATKLADCRHAGGQMEREPLLADQHAPWRQHLAADLLAVPGAGTFLLPICHIPASLGLNGAPTLT